MTTPEEAVRKYLKGIGALPREDPPQLTAREYFEREAAIERAKRRARNFARLLRLRGFEVQIFEYTRSSVVDFYDPYLREKLVKKGVESRVYPDHIKARDYASVATRGSIAFYDSKIDGDIPVSMLRPDIPKRSFLRMVVQEEKPTDITEVHLHMWDHRPTVHVHIEGENVDLEKLVEFVCRIRDISRTFLEEPPYGLEEI